MDSFSFLKDSGTDKNNNSNNGDAQQQFNKGIEATNGLKFLTMLLKLSG